MSVQPAERFFSCRYGRIAAVVWNAGAPRKVLALHGWLDNAASFSQLAPLLPHCEIVAMDFPGHGHSDHRAPGHVYTFLDYLLEIPEVLKQLGWPRATILGHSMGAAIGQLFAVASPSRVDSLIMIENLGPVPSWQPGTAAKKLRQALAKWERHDLRHRRFYTTVEQAIAARAAATPLPSEILRPLVARGLAKTTDASGKPVYHWRTDKRLRLPSLVRLAEDQIQELLAATAVPTTVILADPVTEAMDYPTRAARLQALAADSVHRLPGDHHLHMSQAEAVARLLRAPLSETADDLG